ncbi:hypothetical protein V8Z69_01835 [Microbacterium aurugineum]|uniref:hypothetical protein n=1 Tax=Microbacterium TaxID=33882 RepID=UPI001E43C661|nr:MULTISPECIES: hypothetical protein [unclassified Microbacterium]MCE0508589.1 hypothetical protein [Microbacterium sp. KKR3/1]UUE21627.1 hypothetical protein LRQ07_04950 [Microbacterium sp. J1-1]
MDPLLLAAEWWWLAPTAAAAGTVGWIGLRRRSTMSGRRLEVDAARHDLRMAQAALVERRAALKVARADHARVVAERAARRASPDQVASSRRMLRDVERDAKACAADVKAKQARLHAARAAVPAASAPRPLDRLRSTHDAVVARWMVYETDPARQIAYPEMTDIKQPATVAYLRASERASELRRGLGDRPTPAEFAAYRDAVAALASAFEVAEHAARVKAGEVPAAPAWQDAAQDAIARSTEAIERAAASAASALTNWASRGRRGDPPRSDR